VKIPRDVIKIFETEIDGVSHGSVTLTVHLRDNHPRFTIGRERSFLPSTLAKGVDDSCDTTNYRPGISVSENIK
jgi:hypothetical protein